MYFYVQNIHSRSVSGEEAAHLFSMRVKPGDLVTLCNFQGEFGTAVIQNVDKAKRNIEFEWKDKTLEKKSDTPHILIQAITDKHYMEKLVEILPLAEIHTLYLFPSDHSVPGTIQIQRLEKILIRSCEQSETIWMPKIQLITKQELESIIKQFKPVVLACNSQESFDSNSNPFQACLVGPEGGWSESELQFFNALNLSIISIGKTVYPAWFAGSAFFLKYGAQ
jgi:RsmE family RNA methyltransferase